MSKRSGSPLDLNELMIVNPSQNGAGDMSANRFYEPASGPYGRADIVDEGDVMGRLGAHRGQLEPLGSIPTRELLGEFCSECGGEQMGYYGDAPDYDLIGRYCPDCGMSDGASDEPEPWPEEEADMTGWPGDGDMDYDDHYGRYTDADDDYDMPEVGPEMGQYGPYWNRPLGHVDDEQDDEIGRYVEDRPPAFNIDCQPGDQLSGYVAEKDVDPDCVIKEPLPPGPSGDVPDIFRPYL